MSDIFKNLRHRLRSQDRRNSAPSPSVTGLKRSGAIRKPTNPLFSAQESNERPILRNRSNTMPTMRQEKRKAEAREGKAKTPDQYVSYQKQAMDSLRHNQDLTDLSGSSSSSSSSGNSDTDSDTDDSQRWYDALEWDLERVGQLRDILRIWVEGNVPADEIGDFLVSCLYNCDDHLANRVTRMVDNREPYAHIARVLVEYLQIRDDEDKPLWTQITPGDSSLRPGSIFYMLGPQPKHPVRWPFFESDSDVDHFTLEPLADEGGSESEYDPRDDHLEQVDLARLRNAEHRVHIEQSQNLTEAMTAELITH